MDLDLYIHYLRFENECLKRNGAEFQSFFEELMTKAEPSFVVVKPWGKEGDWKCDGIIEEDGTYFQVYAPEAMSAAETIAKIDADFAGVLEHWGDLQSWTFVWSATAEGLPPAVIERLQELQEENPALSIDNWSKERLWKVAVEKLTTDQRVELLGIVPSMTAANRTTAVEVRTVLNWVAEQEVGPSATDEGFDLTDIADKLEKNDLSDTTSSLVGRSLPIASEVDRYVSGNVDVDFSGKIASRLRAQYEALAAGGASPDGIFIGLVDYVAGDDPTEEEFWAAVGIVSYYFQLCDVFEK